MVRTLSLIATTVLLLVVPARADHVDDDLQNQIQAAAASIEAMIAQAKETEDPATRATLVQATEAMRAHWAALKDEREKRQRRLAGGHARDEDEGEPATLDEDDALRLLAENRAHLEERLAMLTAKLAELRATRTERHPDVVRTRAQRDAVEQSRVQLSRAQKLFDEAQAHMAENHVDLARPRYHKAVTHLRIVDAARRWHARSDRSRHPSQPPTVRDVTEESDFWEARRKAPGDEVDAKMKSAIDEAAAQVGEALAEAAREPDPETKAFLRGKAELLRKRWKGLVEKRVKRMRLLAAAGPHHQDGPATLDEDDAQRLLVEQRNRLEQALVDVESKLAELRTTRRENDLDVVQQRVRREQVIEELQRLGTFEELVGDAWAQLVERRTDEARDAYRRAVEALRAAAGARMESDRDGRVVLHGKPLRAPHPRGPETGARERVEHLRAAAHHLREAGAVEEAEGVEHRIRELEEQLARAAHREAEAPAAVLEAIQGLRREVHQIREDVRELREFLQRAPRRRPPAAR